ncbi:MAG: hypothetical protein ISR05_04960 [Burkholderiales bacterium]|nr:hypothetical protein [Burkholderiales bacterium]MBL6879314.1 hypothetical protein [Burkholderiales bacterium]
MNKKVAQPELPSNRVFGYFFASIFGALGAYLGFKGLLTASTVLVLLAFVLATTAFFKSYLLLPLNRSWMKFGALLSTIVNPIIMGFIYFFLFAPMGIVMRLFRRDELRLKIKARQTHWKSKSNQSGDSDAFKNQF